MKKALIFMLMFFWASNLIAQSSKVDQKFGFRDLSFGQTLNTTQFTLNSNRNPEGIEQYTRKNENLKLGQANLSRITYITVAGKLARVKIESLPTGEDSYALVAVAKENYGNPDKTLDAGAGTVIHSWEGSKASVKVFLFDKRDNHEAGIFIVDNSQKEYVRKHLNELNRTDDL